MKIRLFINVKKLAKQIFLNWSMVLKSFKIDIRLFNFETNNHFRKLKLQNILKLMLNRMKKSYFGANGHDLKWKMIDKV